MVEYYNMLKETLNKIISVPVVIVIVLILVVLTLLTSEAVFADGGMVAWPPQIQITESAQNAIVAWNDKEEVFIISNDIEGFDSAIILRMIPLPSNPTNIEEGDFSSFSKITEIINKKGKVFGRHKGWGEMTLTNPLGSEGTPPGIEITFHENIGAHDVTVVKVNDLDYFLNWIKDFALNKGLETKEISPEFRDGISDYLDRDIKYFVFDVIEKTEYKQSINPLIYRFESEYLFYPLKITAISEIGQSQYAEVNVFLISKGMIDEDIIRKTNLSPSVDFDYYIELSKEDLRKVGSQFENLFQSNAFAVLVYHSGHLSELDEDLIIYSENIHIPTFSDKVDHFLQFIAFSIEKFLNPLFILRIILTFIFMLTWPIGFIYLFLYLAKPIKKQVAQKALKPIVINLTSYVGSFVVSLGVFALLYFLLSLINKTEYGFLLISLIGIIAFIVVFVLIVKSIVKLFKRSWGALRKN